MYEQELANFSSFLQIAIFRYSVMEMRVDKLKGP